MSESSLLGGIRHGIFAGIAFDIDITESYGIGADFLNLIEVTKSVLGGAGQEDRFEGEHENGSVGRRKCIWKNEGT